MKLKETIIHLVGFFKFSYDGSIFLDAGEGRTINDENNEPIAETFIVYLLDAKTKVPTKDAVIIVFNQVGDNLKFLYKKEKFDVVSISDDLIRLTQNGVSYTIERLKLPL